ncbi:ABC transporter permease [Aliicoccus persicus]|uniref:ABC-2 type transport system permease protein n=1 Tax=Aliicoccus persicus TaxID=930138 RepID=A0A662Z250_9STAP|nr:ABC transporter permease [Aliicoccus persicus]SEV88533.1 ABC-2 type transport system permease protein [Aliicoccus persicus]
MELFRLAIITLKINARDFGFWFWMVIYPLLLATMFVITTQNITGSDSLDDITIGVEDENNYYTILSEIEILEVEILNKEEARTALENEEITAFIDTDGDMIVASSGLDETIVSSIVNNIHQVIESDVGFQHYDFEQSYVDTQDYSAHPEVVMFFSLLGMLSFYSLFSVMEFLTKLQPNLSHQGARFYASPTNKSQILISNVMASVFMGLLANGMLIIFLMIVYQGALFDQLFTTLLLILVGNITGAGLGLILGVLPVKNEGFKTTIGILVTLFFAFSGGLAGPFLRQAVIENFPLLHRFNPIGQLTDTMYQINYMANYDNYLPTIILLLIIFVISVIIAIVALRGQQYDSL